MEIAVYSIVVAFTLAACIWVVLFALLWGAKKFGPSVLAKVYSNQTTKGFLFAEKAVSVCTKIYDNSGWFISCLVLAGMASVIISLMWGGGWLGKCSAFFLTSAILGNVGAKILDSAKTKNIKVSAIVLICVACVFLLIPIAYVVYWAWYWLFGGVLMELFDGFECVLWFIFTIFAMLYALTLFIR